MLPEAVSGETDLAGDGETPGQLAGVGTVGPGMAAGDGMIHSSAHREQALAGMASAGETAGVTMSL